MTRWAMVADLRRCVGCQTCTASCKHTNATSPAVQWRKVLDIESGEFPDVKRTFVPVGCMHCSDAPCESVCPSTATKIRPDGIVTIDYDICIGCSYCAVACPYQARYRVDRVENAYGKSGRMRHESQREMPERLGVAQKCTFCVDRIDYGTANKLTPGVDPQATPACVNACIADALHFGDLDDPQSNVSRLLDENASFSMHEELNTGPGFHYLWKKKDAATDAASTTLESADIGDTAAVGPKLQESWDWRAAANFIGGGTGCGIILAQPWAGPAGFFDSLATLLAIFFIGLGLFCVWLETGRPWRTPVNVFRHARTSWMTREAMVAVPLMMAAVVTALTFNFIAALLTVILAAAFLFCQAMILNAAKGIPVWRHPRFVPVVLSTGLLEGLSALGLLQLARDGTDAMFAHSLSFLAAFMVMTIIRWSTWLFYLGAMGRDAPIKSREVLRRYHFRYLIVGHLLPMCLVLIFLLKPDWIILLVVATATALLSGWVCKLLLITRAAYNQGYAIRHVPERGDGGDGPGVQPGW